MSQLLLTPEHQYICMHIAFLSSQSHLLRCGTIPSTILLWTSGFVCPEIVSDFYYKEVVTSPWKVLKIMEVTEKTKKNEMEIDLIHYITKNKPCFLVHNDSGV